MQLTLTSSSPIAPFQSEIGQQDEPIKPFEFQDKTIKEVYGHIKANIKNILLVAPTGSGKTFMTANILRDATIRAKKPLRCMFLVDLNCLIDQAIAEFKELGINCVPFQGSRSKSKRAMRAIADTDVIVASIQTLESRRKTTPLRDLLGDIGLIFADECHTTAFSKSYAALRETYNLGTIFIGLTATPKTEKRDRYLSQFFDVLVKAPPMPEMIRLKRCVPARCFSPDGVMDVSKLHVDRKTGDFDENEQADQIASSLPAIVKAWKEYGDDRASVAYCPRVDNARELAAEFNSQGVPAEYQDGSTPLGIDGKLEHDRGENTRAAQNYRLKTGITKVVCSVGTQTKGWSLRELGCVMMIRATRSLSLFIQCAGRGSRTCGSVYWRQGREKENYILLDFGGNLKRFAPTSPNNYGLNPSDYDISEKIDARSGERINTKFCPQCGFENSIFARICAECDHEFEKPEDEGEQQELDIEIELYEWFDSEAIGQLGFLRSRKKLAYFENRHPDDANKQFKAKYGFLPPIEWHLGAIFGAHPKKNDRAQYFEYLKQFAPHDAWSNSQMGMEFGYGKGKRKNAAIAKLNKPQPWYRVLQVSANCTKAEAKRAYIALAQEWHPDVCDAAIASEMMKVINNAWDKASEWFNTNLSVDKNSF